MFETYLEIQKDKLDIEKLNLDGTHSFVIIGFDTLDNSWLNWHYLAFALI